MAIDKAITYLKKKAPKGEFLAYINPKEAAMLKKAGGSGELVNGIPSYRSAKGMASKEKSRNYSSPSKSPSRSPRGPQEYGSSTRTVNRTKAPPATTYIGGKKYNVTDENRGDRDRAELKQQLMRQPVGGNKIDKFGNTKKNLFRGGGGGIGSLIASLIGMAIGVPGLGLAFSKRGMKFLGDKLGRTNPDGSLMSTKEFEKAMYDKRQVNRLDKLFAAKDRGFNQIGFGDFTKKTMDFTPGQQAKIDDLLAQGYKPSTARNVLTGRDLKEFTESKGLQTQITPMAKPTFSDPFANTVGTTTKVNNLSNDAVSSTTPIYSANNLQQRVDVMNQFDFPFNYSADDLQARAKRAMTQPGFTTTLAPYEKGVPQELQFFDGRPFTAKAYDPYKVNTQQQGINTIDVGYPSNDLMADATTTPTEGKLGLSLMDYSTLKDTGYTDGQIEELQLNPKINTQDVIRDIKGPIFAAAEGGLASMFTRRR